MSDRRRESPWPLPEEIDPAMLEANHYRIFATINGRVAAFQDLFHGCTHLVESEEGQRIAALCRYPARAVA